MEIRTAEFIMSNSQTDKCPPGNMPEYAFIGRSNVGKSSLINMLTGNRKLAMTSSTPGKTMLINHFLINKEWYLVDLPGYGYAKRSKREQSKLAAIIRGYVADRQQLTSLFVLLDVRLPPQRIDMEFIEWLGMNGVPFAIVFTKADKLGKMALGANVEAYLERLREQWEELPPYFISSSSTGAGKKEILDYIAQVNETLES